MPLVIGSNVQEIVPHDQSADKTQHLMQSLVGNAAASDLEAVYSKAPANILEGRHGCPLPN